VKARISWSTMLAAVAFVASAQAQPAPAPPVQPGAEPARQPSAEGPGPRLSSEEDFTPKEDEAAAVLAPQPGGLSAAMVGRRTVANSHTVRSKLAELDAARARLNQTTAQFFPRLTFRAAYTRLSPVSSGFAGALVGTQNPGVLTVGPCPGGAPGQCVLDSQGQPAGAAQVDFPSLQNNYMLSATLTVPLSDYVLRLSNAAAGASANRRAAELQVKAEKLKVRADAEALYYDWLRAKARVAIAEKSLERTRARVKDAKPAYELGTITKADLMRLEALEAGTKQVVLESRTYSDLAERQLSIVMGDKKHRSYAVGEDVRASLPRAGGDIESLSDEALSSRLELKALSEASHSARLGAKALSAGSYPRLDAMGDITYSNPNQRYFPQTQQWRATWSVGVAATWTVGDTFLNSAAASELEATSQSLAAQRDAVADGIRQEVAAHYLAREKAAGAMENSRRQVAAAEEAYRVAVDLYRVGKSTTAEVIDAESDLLAARLSYVNARLELRIADVRLRHAVGRDVGR
jgi:outer membrane protein TolC